MQTGMAGAIGHINTRLVTLAFSSTLLLAACGTGQDDTAAVDVAAAAPVADQTDAPAESATTVDEPAATAPATVEPADSAAPVTAERVVDDAIASDEPTTAPTATSAPEVPTAPPVQVDDATAEAAAASNLGALDGQESVGLGDFQVLDVADGSISTLAGSVSGDRPVLLWFFSPH